MAIFRFSRKQLLIPYALFMLLFIVLPLVTLLYYAFTNKATGNISLANFARFFTDTAALTTLLNSILIGFLSTFFCILLGYPVAYILAKSNLKKKNVLLMLFIMPMWINFVLRINALKELLGMIAILGKANFFNAVLGMVYDFLPFMILPLYTTLTKIDKSYSEAAQDLGAGAIRTFFKVTFPLSMPGIVSGVTMVFMPTMTNYVITDTLGLGKVNIIGKMIESSFGQHNWNYGSAIALILLVIIFISTIVSGKFKDDANSQNRGAGLW